jgi:hypothetical protein
LSTFFIAASRNEEVDGGGGDSTVGEVHPVFAHFPISSVGGRIMVDGNFFFTFASFKNALIAELSNAGCAAGHASLVGWVSGGGVFAGEPACNPRVNGDRDSVDIEANASPALESSRRLFVSLQNMHRFPEVPPNLGI